MSTANPDKEPVLTPVILKKVLASLHYTEKIRAEQERIQNFVFTEEEIRAAQERAQERVRAWVEDHNPVRPLGVSENVKSLFDGRTIHRLFDADEDEQQLRKACCHDPTLIGAYADWLEEKAAYKSSLLKQAAHRLREGIPDLAFFGLRCLQQNIVYAINDWYEQNIKCACLPCSGTTKITGLAINGQRRSRSLHIHDSQCQRPRCPLCVGSGMTSYYLIHKNLPVKQYEWIREPHTINHPYIGRYEVPSMPKVKVTFPFL